ncbi:Crp/Fnr family transcriptional regulator [uncultured Lacinutrix sp.]|uniref:Crp/Fnr family transcriptional regulator n=1 Tax=uncultured Lacinutrix sp. TaxID=574032 RepID=UPI00260E05D4|nr:Crp/Fnr family transcriptional regulator [uncultured Lacinutrix sp.]
MIAPDILLRYKATLKSFSKDRVIFNELDTPQFYFQIKTGKVKMYNITEDGKEFVQGFFEDGKSFGEPPLFVDSKYPASAAAMDNTEVYILPKTIFLDLLKENPEIHLNITKLLCERMVYKATIIKEVSIYPPEHRILTLLNYLKTASNTDKKSLYEVTLTRQQLSELTGLRVETVIRSVKKLEKSNKLSISERKIYL